MKGSRWDGVPITESEIEEEAYCGMLTDSAPFAEYIEGFFERNNIKEDERWYLRDWMSCVWDAALDYARDVALLREELRARADRLDDVRIPPETRISKEEWLKRKSNKNGS